MTPLPSGVNDGQAIAFGCAGPGAGCEPPCAAGPLVVVSLSLRSVFRFENTDLPSKSMIESTRVGTGASPLTNTTCLPSGENAGPCACFTSCVSDGEATGMPVDV